MHVLYLNHVSQMSGAEQSMLATVAGVRKSGVVPHVVLPGPGPLAERCESLDVSLDCAPLRRLRRTANPLRLLCILLRLEQCARRLESITKRIPVELVHSNSTTAHLFAAYAGHRLDAPLVWHVRDLVPLGRLVPWLTTRARAIVAISQAVADRLVVDGAEPEKLEVIHPGVSAPAVCRGGRSVRAEWGIADTDFLFGVVGQIVPWKGHRDFLEAAGRVCRERPDARFVVVGEDLFGDHPDLATEIRGRSEEPPLADRIVLAGQRNDIGDVIDALDCLVLPSHGEPFGRVLVEAMLLGKPAIATNEGGPVEIVKHGQTGVLVPARDPQALADAMLRLMDDRDLARHMGNTGRQRATDLFSVERNVQATVELYEEIVRRNP